MTTFSQTDGPYILTAIEETNHVMLLQQLVLTDGGKFDPTGRYTVVWVDWDRAQVTSAMPGDCSRSAPCTLVAPTTYSGVLYVASFYSRGYARRVYRDLTGGDNA